MRQLALEVGYLPKRQRILLQRELRKIAASVPERPFWAIDGPVEAQLAYAADQTECLARAVWGRSWRDVLGYEQRHLHRFDPVSAGAEARATYQRLLRQMRDAVTTSTNLCNIPQRSTFFATVANGASENAG
jgi:hypothetical protein